MINSKEDSELLEEGQNCQEKTKQRSEDCKEAMEVYKKALVLYETEDDKYNLAKTYFDIGKAYLICNPCLETEVCEKALLNFEKSREIFRESYGEDTEEMVTMLINIARVHSYMANYEDARAFYWGALNIAKRIFGEVNEVVANIYYELAQSNFKSEDYKEVYYDDIFTEEVIGLYVEANGIYEQMGGHELERYKVYKEISKAYETISNRDIAIENYKEAINLSKLIYGDSSPILASDYEHMGELYSYLDNHEEIENYKKALAIYETLLASNPVYTKKVAELYKEIASRINIGGALVSDEAKKNYLKSLEIYENMATPEKGYPEYTAIGEIYKALGNPQEAIKNFEKAFKIICDTSGAENPSKDKISLLFYIRNTWDDILHREKMANSERTINELSEIEKLIENWKDVFSAAWDPNHAPSEMEEEEYKKHSKIKLESIENLILAHGTLERDFVDIFDYLHAIEHMSKVVKLTEFSHEVYGGRSKELASRYSDIATLYYSQGYPQDGKKYADKALEIYQQHDSPDNFHYRRLQNYINRLSSMLDALHDPVDDRYEKDEELRQAIKSTLQELTYHL